MFIRIRRFLIGLFAGRMPVALNIKVYEWGVDMGEKASLSDNVTFNIKPINQG